MCYFLLIHLRVHRFGFRSFLILALGVLGSEMLKQLTEALNLQ